jgi:hypothetical protein
MMKALGLLVERVHCRNSWFLGPFAAVEVSKAEGCCNSRLLFNKSRKGDKGFL